ncbi:flotillin family protein [Sediminitomix flava]|uniref:Putative membrane protein YqiK n=1 Tax=Sediminitomix flava TaxID=379075 RepID=A0A315ZG59_SEDFL|nr:flotillin [Sediminitomix flava]PWJ44576.1 putative membrane protein YqiK [Sediminitomix flava]
MELQASLMLVGIISAVLLGLVLIILQFYKKVPQGKALVRTGMQGLKVNFQGIFVVPVVHKAEIMDISLKTIEISREAKQGLICKDNLRADIRVAFFVRVNNDVKDVAQVAQTIGCERASDQGSLMTLFEAKFSEALKTVGKKFDFADLYNAREEFKREVIDVIGTDLNGYILDDCAIDYLEQTEVEHLDPDNILDSEGIRKITDLTSAQKIQANHIRNEEKKLLTKQDVEAKEVVLALERQQAEAEEKQRREIAIVRAQEESLAEVTRQEERKKSEEARLKVQEELEVVEKNKDRQILVAEKNRERTEVLENERIERERQLAENERERVVELARIEKEKSLEEERRNIQEVIRERVAVQKAVVSEEEKIKDTQAYAEAERQKAVAIKEAEQKAESGLIGQLKQAEADKESAKLIAEKRRIEAQAEFETATQSAEAKKVLADATSAEIAATGMAEAQVLEAKATATKAEGLAKAEVILEEAKAESEAVKLKADSQSEANRKLGEVDADLEIKKGEAVAEVTKSQMIAEAEGMEAKSVAIEKQGMAEAAIMEKKALVEAQRIEAEANALKAMDEESRSMERFKLQLNVDKEVALANIDTQKDIATAQASVMSEGLKHSNIDIVGGESMFFDKMVNSIAKGRSIEKFIDNSDTVKQLSQDLMGTVNGNGSNVIENIKSVIDQLGVNPEDLKNLSVAAALNKLSDMSTDDKSKGILSNAMKVAEKMGVTDFVL